MTLAWFYSDAQRQQQGPVADSYLFNAYQRGEVTLNTLVWREGMAQWLPLSQVAAELGISTAGLPPSMPQGGRPVFVAPPKSGNSGCLVAGIVIGIGGFVVVAILAAIAIPAYQDYVHRAKIMQANQIASELKSSVASFYQGNERCPVNGDDGFSQAADYATAELSAINIGTLDDGRCAVQLIFNQIGAGDTAGKEILHAMDSDMNWVTSSNLPNKMLPASLRHTANPE
jgi:type IV pilus assembly protein PilA